MDAGKLAELKRLLAKATQGPFVLQHRDGYITGHILSDRHTYAGNAVSNPKSVCDENTMTREDGEYITALLNHAAELIADAERLRSLITGLEFQQPDKLLTMEPEAFLLVGQEIAKAAKLGAHLYQAQPAITQAIGGKQ